MNSPQIKQPDPDTRQKAQKVYGLLEQTYGLPEWRQPLPAVDELISTILSQNTNDVNRDRAFENLCDHFPTWDAVRDADQAQIIEAVRIAGLANQKGPRIQQVLRQISQERGEISLDFLRDLTPEEAHAWLTRQKGVGPKTAAIVMQFSLGIPAFPVDTHVYRVSGRLGIRPAKMNVERTHQWMEKLFEPAQYGPGHLNIIQHGREICHARKPECERCPLAQLCDYYQSLR
jgi:endonuclease III